MIVLFQFEECENSKPVRRRLTELAVDFIAVSAPEGHPEKDTMMQKLLGSAKTPAIWDTSTGELVQGETECISYIDKCTGVHM